MTSEAATFIACRIKNKTLSHQDWRKVAEWLGCYTYILPAERVVLPELGILLAQEFNGDLTAAWHRYCDVETCLSQQVQKEIIQWISA